MFQGFRPFPRSYDRIKKYHHSKTNGPIYSPIKGEGFVTTVYVKDALG